MGRSFLNLMKIIHENCDLEKVNNIQLPNNAYVVTYIKDGAPTYDISSAAKQVEIFDTYYDKYKKDLISIIQSKGTANPKLWKGVTKEAKDD